MCQTPEEIKAWSQNIGHSNVMTTFTSYGEVQEGRQSEIFKRLKEPHKTTNQNVDDIANAVVRQLQGRI
jgi:hypothetical protein